MAERKAYGVEDTEMEEESIIHIQYTDDDKVESFAKSIKNSMANDDRFKRDVKKLRKLDGLSPGMKSKMTRRINKYLTGDDASSKAVAAEQITGYGMFDVVEPLYNLDYLAKLYEINPTHFAAVNAKVSNVISLGYQWEETQKTQDKIARLVSEQDEDGLDKTRRKLSRIRGQLDAWLESLNQEDTWIEILEKVYADREIMGVGYLEIGRRSDGQIGYVGHIPAHTIRMRRKRDGFVQIVADKVTFFKNFGTDTADPIGDDPNPNEILPFRKYSPRSTYYGVPDIISALGAVAGAEFASRFNLDYFEHKAVPRYLIIVKGAKLSPASERKLIKFFQTNLKGENHRSLYVPLPASTGDKKVEVEIKPVENNIQDASFQKFHEMNRNEILMVHRVPMTKVGLSADVSLAVAREADRMFKEQVARPIQKNIEKRLEPLFAEKTDVFKFKFIELTLTDEETKSKIHERQVRNGIILRNEAREELGLKGIDGGDELVDIYTKPTTQTADLRSQTTRGRARERADDSGANNSDPSTRQENGEGERDRSG